MTLRDHTDKILSEADKRIRARLQTAALLVERTAKQKCPVRTGTLKRSITHVVEKRTARVGTNVEYAPYVEMGTKHMSARPYLRPALEANKARIKELFSHA